MAGLPPQAFSIRPSPWGVAFGNCYRPDPEKIESLKVSSKELRGPMPLPPALKIVTSPWSPFFHCFLISFWILFFSLFHLFSTPFRPPFSPLFLSSGPLSPKTSLLPFSSPLWCFSYIFTLPSSPRSLKIEKKPSMNPVVFLSLFK